MPTPSVPAAQRPTQVLVEAVIFEMSVEGYSDLSVQFGAILNDAILGGVEFSLGTRPSLTSLISSVADGGTPSPGSGGVLGVSAGWGKDQFVGLLTAMVSTRSTRLLATPSIMTLNNEEAEIVVAQNVPFVTGSFTSTGDGSQPENPFQTIERQDTNALSDPLVSLLKDNDIRVQFRDHVNNPMRIAAPVKTNRFANVIACDPHIDVWHLIPFRQPVNSDPFAFWAI